MARTFRKPSKLSESLHRRLNSYAVAASAAGVGMLALRDRAEAKVIYTPTHVVIAEQDVYQLDLNHDHIPDFNFSNTFDGYLKGVRLEVLGVSYKNLAAGFRSAYNREHFAYALNRGARIPVAYGKYGAPLLGATLVRDRPNHTSNKGYWGNVSNRYLGLQFQIGGRTHYGWARMTVNVHWLSAVATLTGYAYETIPNKPIMAGRTKGPDVITVRPASLGHLARGAAAIPAWRGKDQ